MTIHNTDLEQWLTDSRFDQEDADEDNWDPGFEAERRIVNSKLGFYNKLFKRPEKFVKRFYHTVYPLTIESWFISTQSKLYSGFCTITAELDIRFQPTLKYASANREFLAEINQHIKASYGGLVQDAIDRELLKLVDGTWIQTGLHEVEKKIALSVNEFLTINNIQCRTFCTLKPLFEDFSDETVLDGRFAQESVYLSVIKKHFEFREKQSQEKLRQEEELENQKFLHQHKQLQQFNKEEELQRLKAAQEAEGYQRLLKDKEKLQVEQFKIEKRLHEEKIAHEIALKEITWQAEIHHQKNLQTKQRELEQQNQLDKLADEILLKEKALTIEINEYEKQQVSWNEANERAQIEKLKLDQRLKQLALEAEFNAQAFEQTEKKKMLETLQIEKIEYETRLKDIQLAAEIEEQEKRFEATKNSDEYLRREIELLIMEKQRVELAQAIKKSNQ